MQKILPLFRRVLGRGDKANWSNNFHRARVDHIASDHHYFWYLLFAECLCVFSRYLSLVVEMVSGQFLSRNSPHPGQFPIPDSSHPGHSHRRQFPSRTVPIPDNSHRTIPTGQFPSRTFAILDINLEWMSNVIHLEPTHCSDNIAHQTDTSQEKSLEIVILSVFRQIPRQ